MDTLEPSYDGTSAYFFRSGDLGAVTLDSGGFNLPSQRTKTPWVFVKSFILGVQHVGLAEINPEPIIRGIRARGYYVWPLSRGGEGQSQ